jgi:hypothetical protein
VIGTRRRDKIINDDIRNKLQVESLNDTVNKYREKWENHVERMTKNGIPRQMTDYQLQEIRNRG